MEYWGKNGTFVVAVLGGTLWLWPNAIRPLISKDTVAVLSCDSRTNAVIVNPGVRSIFVSHIFMHTANEIPRHWRSQRVKFEQALPAGQFTKQEFPPGKFAKQKMEIIAKLKDDEFQELIERAMKDEDCYEVVFYAEQDPFGRELKRQQQLNTYKVTAYVEYYSADDASVPKQQPFPAFGILHRANRRECYTAVDLQRLKNRGVGLSPEVLQDLDEKLRSATTAPSK